MSTVDEVMQRSPRAARRSRFSGAAALTALIALIGLLAVLWYQARPWDSRVVNTPAKLGAVSAFAALVGLLLFAVAILLSARTRLAERALGGLDRVYRVHHNIGVVAFAMLALHPVFLAWRYAHVSWDRASALWWPDADDWAITAGQVALYVMAAAMFVTMFMTVRHTTLVWTQRILGVMFVPAAYHALDVGGDTSEYDPLRWYVWLIVIAGAGGLVGHTILGRFVSPHRSYRVERVRELPGAITELWLRPTERSLHFVPGQFVFARFHSGAVGGEPHPFSIASEPGSHGIRLVVKHLGDYTNHVGEIEVGADAILEGPYGRFSFWFVPGRRQVWVAGGIGIAPFLSMAEALPPGYDVDLFYGFPDEHASPFSDELLAIASLKPALRVHLVNERFDGIITAASIANAIDDFDRREFLLCGPPAMMHALHEQLTSAGVSPRQIRFEEFEFG